jgi:hypothetical protein
MEGTSYRPILPDEATTEEICSGNRPGFPEITLQNKQRNSIRPKQHHQSIRPPRVTAVKKDATTDDVKKHIVLSNNKILTIGLFVIVVILIIIIIIQIMRSRKICEEDEDIKKKTPPKPGSTTKLTQQHVVKQNVNDNLLKQYMQKKPKALRKKMSAMASYVSGRKPDDDSQRIQTIVEESSTEPDPEHAAMRSNINAILQEGKDDNDTELQEGSTNIVDAEEIVQREIARMRNGSRQHVRDEALIEQSEFIADTNGGVIVEEIDDDTNEDSDDEAPLGTCTFILVSGKRQGQQCGRKCSDSTDRCVRHHGK